MGKGNSDDGPACVVGSDSGRYVGRGVEFRLVLLWICRRVVEAISRSGVAIAGLGRGVRLNRGFAPEGCCMLSYLKTVGARASVAASKVRFAAQRSAMLALTLCIGLAFSGTAFATDPITLPDVGVDVAGTATAVGTALGSTVAVALTLGGAFFVVRIGYKWVRSMVR